MASSQTAACQQLYREWLNIDIWLSVITDSHISA